MSPRSVRLQGGSAPAPSVGPGARTKDIAGALNGLLADVFAIYLKTKNFQWHISGPHFHDYHRMLDDQAAELFALVDPLAERVRKLGATTVRSIGHLARLQRLVDNDSDQVTAHDMLTELRDDNRQLGQYMKAAHALCSDHGDIASASLLESWTDEAEGRAWFLSETIAPRR